MQKKSRTVEAIESIDFFQPLQLPISGLDDFYYEELNLDFIDSLIEVNRALNLFPPLPGITNFV